MKLEKLRSLINDDVTLVAVSKTRSLDEMEKLYLQGVRNFGENKAQELVNKRHWHHDVIWHFIGHLQSNKVKEVVRDARLIHSLDRLALVRVINKEAIRQNKKMPCLIQVNIAKEDTKGGFMLEEMVDIIKEIKECSNIEIWGLMVMGPHTNDESVIRVTFNKAKQLFEELKQFEDEKWIMKYLSMGMSNDFDLAQKCGSNMLRIGSLLFEEGVEHV